MSAPRPAMSAAAPCVARRSRASYSVRMSPGCHRRGEAAAGRLEGALEAIVLLLPVGDVTGAQGMEGGEGPQEGQGGGTARQESLVAVPAAQLANAPTPAPLHPPPLPDAAGLQPLPPSNRPSALATNPPRGHELIGSAPLPMMGMPRCAATPAMWPQSAAFLYLPRRKGRGRGFRGWWGWWGGETGQGCVAPCTFGRVEGSSHWVACGPQPTAVLHPPRPRVRGGDKTARGGVQGRDSRWPGARDCRASSVSQCAARAPAPAALAVLALAAGPPRAAHRCSIVRPWMVTAAAPAASISAATCSGGWAAGVGAPPSKASPSMH